MYVFFFCEFSELNTWQIKMLYALYNGLIHQGMIINYYHSRNGMSYRPPVQTLNCASSLADDLNKDKRGSK